MDPHELIIAFVDRINQHDVDGLCELMSEDHVFVDSLGSRVQGRENMRNAWIRYFYMVPDFTISCTEIIQKGNVLGIFGAAHGTYSVDGKLLEENRWEMPAAWRAVVRDGQISERQVYADNEPVRRIMNAQRQ